MSIGRILAIGALVTAVVMVAAAVGTWRDFCQGLSLERAAGMPGCPLLVSGPSLEVTFPDDWQAGEISPAVYEEIVREGGPWAAAAAVGWDEDVRSGCLAIVADAIEGRGSIPTFIGPPEASWSVVLRAAGRPDPRAGDWASWVPAYGDELTLPAGPAARVVHELPDGRSGTQYSVEDPEGLIILACFADTTPPDRWLSVAETLDALPAAE